MIGLCVALLCATVGTEFEAAFAAVIATIYEIDNGYVAALAAQTIDIIICGIGRIFEGYVGYFDIVLERGIGGVFNGIFNVLVAPAGAFPRQLNCPEQLLKVYVDYYIHQIWIQQLQNLILLMVLVMDCLEH